MSMRKSWRRKHGELIKKKNPYNKNLLKGLNIPWSDGSYFWRNRMLTLPYIKDL